MYLRVSDGHYTELQCLSYLFPRIPDPEQPRQEFHTEGSSIPTANELDDDKPSPGALSLFSTRNVGLPYVRGERDAEQPHHLNHL